MNTYVYIYTYQQTETSGVTWLEQETANSEHRLKAEKNIPEVDPDQHFG